MPVVHPSAIAGFLGALAAAHATVAGYSLVLYGRPAPEVAPAEAQPRRSAAPAEAQPRRSAPPASPAGKAKGGDHEPLVFGLLNVAVAALDGGLAWAYAVLAASSPADAGAGLAVAGAGQVGAVAFLLHFVLQYTRTERPRRAIGALYAAAGALAIGCAAGAAGVMRGVGAMRREDAWFLGALVPVLRAGPTPLEVASAVFRVVAAALALVVLARALGRGRREAVGFAGLTLLAVAVVWDALRSLGWAGGPPVAPFGFAAFVNGVVMTLLGRFAALRSQLEGRARQLKDRTRALARSYEELRAAQDELVKKEQLTAVGELSAVVAHEVRNPLAIISNAVATLRRSGVADADRETLLRILDEETTRLNRLVGDLLRFARPIAIERQLVSLREICERGMALAEGKVGLDHELLEPEPTAPVWADPNLVRQVTDNLIDNAIQAMSGGGVLTVTLVNLELDGVPGVEVQIQDTGEGMDTEVRARALDPFFTTRASGTGLGLSIVARIVDGHGGVLRIKSKSGAGTVMHVFFPRLPAPRRRDSDPGPPSSVPADRLGSASAGVPRRIRRSSPPG